MSNPWANNQNLQCCSTKSHKTFVPDQALQAEMQESPPPFESLPKEIYTFGHKVNTACSAHVSHSESCCPMMKLILAATQCSYFTSFCTHDDSWLLLIDNKYSREHVLQQKSGFWHFKSQQGPVANSNSVLNVYEAFPGSPFESAEPRELLMRKQGLAGWILVVLHN